MLEVDRRVDRTALGLALAVGTALAVALGIGGFACTLARAEVREADGMLTDRPDFTATTRVVGPRRLQIEGGFLFEETGATTAYRLPGALIRAGLTERIELRFGPPDYMRIDSGGETDHRIGDASFGAKLQLSPHEAAWGAALLPLVTAPLDRYDKARPAPALGLAWSAALPNAWSIGGTVSHAWLRTADRGKNTLFPTLAAGHPVGERGGTFFECAASFADGERPTRFAHHGYTYAVAPDLKLDLHGGLSWGGNVPDYFIGAGFAWQPTLRP